MNANTLPHNRLVAFEVATQLVSAVVAAQITDAELRDQATRAAKSAALNTAEGAARSSPKDKARVFAIARGECAEAAAAVQIAVALKEASPASLTQVDAIANRLYGLLTGLCR